MAKKALITGITGQDGSYLAEFLIEKGYEVHGLVRRSSTLYRSRIDHLFGPSVHRTDLRHELHYGDLTDSGSIYRMIAKVRPDEIYNLAAQSHVGISFELAEYTSQVTGLGALHIFEGVREAGIPCRIYQAGSSEMFGKSREVPQSETTPLNPRSPYGAAKVYAHTLAVNFREGYGMFIANGILFNHESPRRGENFVTRKVSLAAAAVKLGLEKGVTLGNLDARRDWGYAKDYVRAMWLMLQQDQPDDYVVATGESHSVRELCEVAFQRVGLDYHEHVTIDPHYFRPTEIDHLIGDASKARRVLGWEPHVGFRELIELMVDSDLEYLRHRPPAPGVS